MGQDVYLSIHVPLAAFTADERIEFNRIEAAGLLAIGERLHELSEADDRDGYDGAKAEGEHLVRELGLPGSPSDWLLSFRPRTWRGERYFHGRLGDDGRAERFPSLNVDGSLELRRVPAPIGHHVLFGEADRWTTSSLVGPLEAMRSRYARIVSSFAWAIVGPNGDETLRPLAPPGSAAWRGLRRLLGAFDVARHVQLLELLGGPWPAGTLLEMSFGDACEFDDPAVFAARCDAHVAYTRWIDGVVRAVANRDVGACERIERLTAEYGAADAAAGVTLFNEFAERWQEPDDVTAWAALAERSERARAVDYLTGRSTDFEIAR